MQPGRRRRAFLEKRGRSFACSLACGMADRCGRGRHGRAGCSHWFLHVVFLLCRVSRLGLLSSILPEFFEIEASEPVSHGLTAKTVDAMNMCVTRLERQHEGLYQDSSHGLRPPPYLLAMETHGKTGEQIQWFRIVVPVRLRSNCGTVIVTCAQPTRRSQTTAKDRGRQARQACPYYRQDRLDCFLSRDGTSRSPPRPAVQVRKSARAVAGERERS